MAEWTANEAEELESLMAITRSSGWQFIRQIFSRHRTHCLEQMKVCLKNYEDRKAGEWLAKSEESKDILALIQNRQQELVEKREKIANGNDT